MSWNRLPWDIRVLIFRDLAELPPVPEFWNTNTLYRPWTRRKQPELDCLSAFLVARSWTEDIQQVVLEENPAERVLAWMGESLALKAAQRAIDRQGLVRRRCGRNEIAPWNVRLRQGEEASVDVLLVVATSRAHVSCMELLLNYGANPRVTYFSYAENILNLAIFTKSLAVVKLLIDAGADIDCGPSGDYAQERVNAPLAIASLTEHIPSVELLLERGANPDVMILQGAHWELYDDPWEYATRHGERGRPRLLEAFLRHGMTIDHSKYDPGKHPVFRALDVFNIECAAILVRAGAFPDSYDEYIRSSNDWQFLFAVAEVEKMLKQPEARSSRLRGKFGAVVRWVRKRIRSEPAAAAVGEQ